MILREARNVLYEEVSSFARHNPGDHSYSNFQQNSGSSISANEYANIYWTLIFTKEIKEGPNAPPKKSQTEILSYLEQRVNQIGREKKQKRKRRIL
jgi:hypothetical protein